MANQVIVTNTGNVQVALTPPPNVQVQISRAAIGTVSNVPTANFANYAANVTSSNQPNITTVGTLGNLIVSGNTTVNNLTVTGNFVANVSVNTANYANFANIANIANSVAVANVSGIGNIATINLDGSSSNVLFGNGVFAPESTSIANANYANFAGEAFSVSGSNVNGAVNLANFATTANAVAGANVSGTVANANFASYSEQANNANLATYATTANAVAGANVSGQVANALVAGTVYTNAQPNITSVGTLTGLASSANISAPYFIGNVVGNISGNLVVPGTNTSVLFNQAGNAGASDAFQFNYATNVATITGNLSATYISGNGGGLSNIAGANVTGVVANANYAAYAGQANTANLSTFATTANAVAGANVSGVVANANYSAYAGQANNANLATFATTANAVAGANVSGIVANANFASYSEQANNANLATFATTANAVAGANVSGQVANALVAGTVYTNAQPNITSLGNLTSLTVSGDAGIAGNLSVGGNITYVNVTNLVVQDPVIELGGGPNGAPLTTNDGKDRGTLLHYYTTQPIDAFMGWDNGNGEFAFGSNVTNNTDVMTFNTFGNVRAQTFLGNLTGLASSATVAASANSVAGANVSGDVAGANHANVADVANSVSGSNVSGAVGLATFATTANAVAGANVSGAVAYATTANSVAGANVSGDVAGANHANIADVANSVAGANVSGAVAYATTANSVAVGNVSGIGNIATTNYDGNASNILYGNGGFFALPIISNVGNANYSNFAGTVITNAQPNITSVGILSNLSVTGNVNAGNVNSGVLQAVSSAGGALKNASGASQLQWGAGGGNNLTVDVNININPANGQVDISPTGNGGHVHIKPTGNNAVEIAPNTAGVINNMIIGNVTPQPANVTTLGATGNVTASYFIGNGSSLTSITGGNVSGTVANANYSAYANIAASANSVAVANVSGIGNIAVINLDGSSSNVLFGNGVFAPESTSIANANYANFAGDVVNSTQSNITTVGTLTNVTVAGNVFAPAIVQNASSYDTRVSLNSAAGIIEITSAGNSTKFGPSGTVELGGAAQVIGGTFGGSGITLGASQTDIFQNRSGNVTVQVGNSGTISSIWNFNNDGNLVLPANSFAVKYANGTQVNLDGPVANANYANFAGTAYSVSGANVSGEVANANYASYANVAASANSVAVGNVSGIGNIATINLDGSSSNVLFGNGVFAPESTSIANANYANFAGQIVDATQSNITLLGTLTDLYMSNANVHLGTNTNANIPSTNRIAIGNSAAGGGTIVTHTFVNYDYANGILELDSTSGIVDGMYITGTGFDGTQVAFNVIDSTTCESDPPTSTPSGILTFNGAQGANSIAIGASAGYERQAATSIAIGANAGYSWQDVQSVAIGFNAGSNHQGVQAVAIGFNAGAELQGDSAFAMGNNAGSLNQSGSAIAIGRDAGANTQGLGAVSIGQQSGTTTQGQGAVALGRLAGQTTQGANSVAIGRSAGLTGQGLNAVAIGKFAGPTNQAANTIILNATGANLNQTTANTFTVKPVRQANTSNVMFYNNSTGEISYDDASNLTVGFANIANTANSVAVANVSGIGNIATVNLDGNVSNLLTGTGTWVAIPTTSPNANFANFAGQIVDATQSNITSTGNLISLNINNGVAGSTTKQFDPNGISIGSTANVNLMANSSFVDIDYGNGQGGGNVLLGKTSTYLKARGNASSLTAANVSDRVGRTNYMFYNGTANVLAAATHVNPGAGVTFNTNANAITTAGQYAIITGNPSGDQGNANALSNQNLYTFDPFGRLTISQGAAGSTGVAIQVNTYGGSAGNAAVGAQTLLFNRARGNRDGNLSVQPNDQLGGLLFSAHNGTTTFVTRTSSITALVDSTYVANTANIPVGLRFITCDNTASYTTTFSANGSTTFPGSIATSNGVTVTMNNISTVNPSFGFSTYNNANSLVNPYTFFRARGNLATPAAAQVNDTVSSITYNIYADAGNTFSTVASTSVTVSDNDGAGNVASTYNVTAKAITLTGNVSANNISTTGNANIGNLQLNRFQENVFAIGSTSGTITPDFNNGSIQSMTLNGNITMNTLGNAIAGRSMTLIITQDGTGNRTLTSSMKFAGGSNALSTAASSVDIISVFYDGTTYYSALTKGYV